jgi:hypothetical protein
MVIKINSNKRGKVRIDDEERLFAVLEKKLKPLGFNVYYKNYWK